MKKENTLSEMQMMIMRILWKQKNATVNQVQQALIELSKPLAPTTVATMLSRLEKRKLITHTTENRQYVYAPNVSEGEVRQSMVKDLIQKVFQGDLTALVSHLVKNTEIDAHELTEIQQLIADQQEEDHNATR